MTLRIDIITGFPDMLQSVLKQSMIKKGRDAQAVAIHLHDLRSFTNDKHRTIDDYPYGGGPGMVLKIEPFIKCLNHIKEQTDFNNAKIILMTPRGSCFPKRKLFNLAWKNT